MTAKESPSRQIWLFNLGRQDLPWVVLLSVFCASVALIVRGGQGDRPEGRHAWKDLLVICGTLGSLVLCILALVKICYSYFKNPIDGMVGQGYTQLEEGGEAVTTDKLNENLHKPQGKTPPPAPVQHQSEASYARLKDTRPISESLPTTGRSLRSSYSTAREEDDIDCGLFLEASALDFEYNGVRHQKGSLRVIKVEQDGVCEVSFLFVYSEVLCSVFACPHAMSLLMRK
jgi:hypothetical protein